MAKNQNAGFLYETSTKIQDEKRSKDNLEEYYKAGKVSKHAYNYLSKKYYPSYGKGLLNGFLQE